jgi:pimeloyl-ACP methyl ester carboxylesterase
MDWSDPAGPTIELALNRSQARVPSERLGSLLINPGGPGGSGKDLLEPFVEDAGERLLDSYDVVGFDPRGVAQSTPVACGTSKQLDDYYVTDVVIETQRDLDDARERTAAFAALCREATGPVLENVDTVSAARDMDVIRAVLGDSKLNFLGFSYGTQLGATYAQVYPDRVGRVVLDGAVDFLLPSSDLSLQQAAGFENALANFIDWCIAQDECALDKAPEAARRQIADIALQARDEGFPSGETTDVNGNLMIYGIIVTLYDEGTWEYLMYALNEVISRDTARVFYELANFYLDRDPVTGDYLGNSTVAFTAISCLDDAQEEWGIDKQRAFMRDVNAASPTFGWWFGGGGGCGGWAWEGKSRVTSLDDARGAGPMLVVGTTDDPATPYSWAVSLAQHLDAPLLTWEGDGHTAYGRSNQCITDAVDAYLVDGTVPPDGTVC